MHAPSSLPKGSTWTWLLHDGPSTHRVLAQVAIGGRCRHQQQLLLGQRLAQRLRVRGRRLRALLLRLQPGLCVGQQVSAGVLERPSFQDTAIPCAVPGRDQASALCLLEHIHRTMLRAKKGQYCM